MTLVEMLIALAISATILSALGGAIYAVTSVTGRGNAQAAALQDLQRAVYWINYDGQMTQSCNLTDGAPSVNSVLLQWVDGDGISHTSSYILTGEELVRTCDGETTTAAVYISGLEFSLSNDIITYRVESTPPGRWATTRETFGLVNLRPFDG